VPFQGVKATPALWQVEHGVALTAVWLMVQVRKPFGIVVLVWHWSQALVPTGIWPVGLVTTGVAPANDLPVSWQTAHAVVATWLWSMVQVAKPPGTVVLVWQVEHCAVVGKWFTVPMVTMVAPGKLLPVAWQLLQLVLTLVWSMVHFEKLPSV